jgi:hypothetical protein
MLLSSSASLCKLWKSKFEQIMGLYSQPDSPLNREQVAKLLSKVKSFTTTMQNLTIQLKTGSKLGKRKAKDLMLLPKLVSLIESFHEFVRKTCSAYNLELEDSASITLNSRFQKLLQLDSLEIPSSLLNELWQEFGESVPEKEHHKAVSSSEDEEDEDEEHEIVELPTDTKDFVANFEAQRDIQGKDSKEDRWNTIFFEFSTKKQKPNSNS